MPTNKKEYDTKVWEDEFLQPNQSFANLLREVNNQKNNTILLALANIHDALFNAEAPLDYVRVSVQGGDLKIFDQKVPSFLRGLLKVFNNLLANLPSIKLDSASCVEKIFAEDNYYYANRGLTPFFESLSEANLLKEVESFVMEKRLKGQLQITPPIKSRLSI